MALRAKSKYVPAARPASNAGVTLYCGAQNVSCHWIRVVLAEKDVPGVRIELVTGSEIGGDLALLNPARSLPTLTDRETVIYPARVIAEYLDERYPHPPMLPQEPALRARLRMAMEHLEHELLPELERIEIGGSAGKAARKRLATQLVGSARLFPARHWFLGQDFSIVDCAWTALLWRLASLKLELPPGGDPVTRYAERAFGRPRFRASLIAAAGAR